MLKKFSPYIEQVKIQPGDPRLFEVCVLLMHCYNMLVGHLWNVESQFSFVKITLYA